MDATGKRYSPIKVYAKDMIVSLVAAPILLVLCTTGVVANFGFMLGSAIADVIANVKF